MFFAIPIHNIWESTYLYWDPQVTFPISVGWHSSLDISRAEHVEL